MNLDGSNQVQLTKGGPKFYPSISGEWPANGNGLIYMTENDGTFSIMKQSLRGKAPETYWWRLEVGCGPD